MEESTMDTDQDKQDQEIKAFVEKSELNTDVESLNNMSHGEFEDHCIMLAKGVKKWIIKLDQRLTNIERRLGKIEGEK